MSTSPERGGRGRLTLRLVLTEQCNLRCAYCYAAKKDRVMPADLLATILAAARAESGRFGRVSFELTGGEPLLAFPLVAAVLNATRDPQAPFAAPVDVTVLTNGLLLTEPRLDLLAAHGAKLRVSLDGGPGAHRLYRTAPKARGDDSYQGVVAALGQAQLKGIDLSVNMVVAPQTVAMTAESFFTVRDICGSRVKVSPAIGLYWPEPALDLLDAGLGRINALVARHPSLFATQAGLKALRQDLTHADYVLGRGIGGAAHNVAVTIDPEGRIYRDEFEPKTRRHLLAGRMEKFKSFRRIALSGPDSMQLIYAQGLYEPEVLEGQKRAYELLKARVQERLDLLSRYARRRPPVWQEDDGEDAPGALSLIAPLKPRRQRIEGFILTEVWDNGLPRYRFRHRDGQTLEVLVLPRSQAPNAYALTRRHGLVVKSETLVTDLSDSAKRLLTLLAGLIARQEADPACEQENRKRGRTF